MVSHGCPCLVQELLVLRQQVEVATRVHSSALGLIARQRLELLDARSTEVNLFVELHLARPFAGVLDSKRVLFRRQQTRKGQHLQPIRRRIVDDV